MAIDLDERLNKERKIRTAIIDDADNIADILIKSYNMTSIEARTTFINESKIFNFIVVEKGKEIIGLVSWVMHGLPKHGLCELNRIAVLPAERGKGIGKTLFDNLVKDAEQFFRDNDSRLRKIFLFTHETNKAAEKFYTSVGLDSEAKLKNHYYDGVDELVFSKFFANL